MHIPNAPLRFLPNIRSEKSDSTTGYIWGKLKKDSNIVKGLSERDALLVETEDIVSERWIASDDREYPSLVLLEDGKTVTFSELLEKYGKEILGKEHMREFGPYLGCIMKLIDTNEDTTKGALSVQVHPKTGHPTRPSKPEMWRGMGSVYLGWKQPMTSEILQECSFAGNLEEKMHKIDVDPSQLILVAGGIVHAIRANSFLAEWSKAPDKEDIVKGNIKAATVSPYDRTDGKTPRPGKEDIEGTIEVMKQANTFQAITKENLFVDAEMLMENDEGDSYISLFDTEEVGVNEWHITNSIEMDVSDRGFPLFVEKGSILLSYTDGEMEIYAGEEVFLPAYLGETIITNTASEKSILQSWWRPL